MLRYFIQDRIEGARFDFFFPQIFDEIIDVFQSFSFLKPDFTTGILILDLTYICPIEVSVSFSIDGCEGFI